LDRIEAAYEISLIGSFSKFDNTQESFERAAKAHHDDGRIKLLGRLSRSEILEELSNNDFFVLLSDFEGLPLSLGEAMARGCVPIVASSPSGVPEIVESGTNGIILEGRDYDEWTRVLADLWTDRKRLSEMSKQARVTVRDRFTVERVGGEFDELLSRVAAETAAHRYTIPPALHWGNARSPAGDVLPPPNLHRPAAIQMPGLS
jgi:glycosyltransferase involved in cell wall biosynthesis